MDLTTFDFQGFCSSNESGKLFLGYIHFTTVHVLNQSVEVIKGNIIEKDVGLLVVMNA